MINVAKSQQRYIKDLQEFLARLGPGRNHPNGLLRLSGQSNEQRIMLSAKIHFILEERQTFLEEVNEIFLEVKAIEESVTNIPITSATLVLTIDARQFYQLSTLKTSQDIAQRLGEIVAATDCIGSLANGIGPASDRISSAIRRLRKETVLEMQRQGKRFRRAWWRRIIPSRERYALSF